MELDFVGLLILFYTSVAFQVILTIFGSFRKRCSSKKWFSFLLWSAYQLTDVVATTCLGMITGAPTNTQYKFPFNSRTISSSFLLFHLGGPDSITALSLVDNELCFRHSLKLVYLVGVAGYCHVKILLLVLSLPKISNLWSFWFPPRMMMFLAGISKCGERTWALHSANMDSIRDSMLPPPNPGPNTLVLKEDDHDDVHNDVGEPQSISMTMDEYAPRTTAPLAPMGVTLSKDHLDSNKAILLRGYYYFYSFRCLFVDLMVSYTHIIDSQRFFLEYTCEVAFQLIDVELRFMYDMLFTKATVVRTRLACILRILRLFAILLALISSIRISTPTHISSTHASDKLINPFVWSLIQEMYEVIQMLLSEWTVIWLNNHSFNRLSTIIFGLILSCRLLVSKIIFLCGCGVKEVAFETKTIWWYNNTMAQYNLLSFCFKDEPTMFTRILHIFSWGKSIHGWIEKSRNTTYLYVPIDLKDFIYKQFKEMVQTTDQEIRRSAEFHNARGKWVMARNNCVEHNCLEEIGWSVDVEFDRSILIWHVATDLCYYYDDLDSNKCEAATLQVQVSKAISNYLLYLLLICPFMLNNIIGKIRFQDTCATIEKLFVVPKDEKRKKRKLFSFILQRKKSSELDEEQAKAYLMKLLTSNSNVQVLTRETKSDESKSELLEAFRLVKLLQLYEKEKRWNIISGVWVEMLSYAASNCSGKHHAQRLSDGGEFLTKIWLLMAHLGMLK